MHRRSFAFAAGLIILIATSQFGQNPNNKGYLMPPKEVVEAFDATPLPQAILSPSKQLLALTWRLPNPTVAELSQPMLRLAGERVNPRTNGLHRTTNIYAVTIKKISDGSEIKVTLPPQAAVTTVRFSPDSSRLAIQNRKDDHIELWIADTATGRAKLVSAADGLNTLGGDPCDWLKDSVTMICEFVPAGRGPAPVEPTVPNGPNVQETKGKAAPAPTYEDMLKTVHDEALFEYYFTSQIASINTGTGAKVLIGKPAIFTNVTPSPNGEYLLLNRIKRPYSHLIPMNGFPQDVEIWTRRGDVARKIADIPSSEGVSLTGVRTGPRSYRWRPDQPATIVWVEALDNGDLKNKVPFRDK